MKNAIKSFDKALKLVPDSEDALFWKARAYSEAYEYYEAGDLYGILISMKGSFSEKVDKNNKIIQRIQRAAPQI